MVRRFLEHTLHTGRVAYMRARGLTGVEYPVLVEPLEERYEWYVATAPYQEDSGLFYRLYDPTPEMHQLATYVFGDWYQGWQNRIEDDLSIWEAVRRIHWILHSADPNRRRRAESVMPRVAQALGNQYGEVVSPLCLAASAEAFRGLGVLATAAHPIAASAVPASLLLMLGVPRERVAVFGVYYQDPTVYYHPNTAWYAGFLAGTPFHAVVGIFFWEEWVLIDFSLPGYGEYRVLYGEPHLHLWPPDLGPRPDDGAQQVLDYVHPFTMVCAPPAPWEQNDSPLLNRIPLLQF
jgi:hypothetical protein